MFRRIAQLQLVFAVVFVLAAGAKRAHAESRAAADISAETQPSTAVTPRAPTSLHGFDALLSAGWGAATGKIVHLELAPYGASFGVDVGYTWSSGFRLGGYFSQSLGRSVRQPRDSRYVRDYEFIADTSSLNGGLSLGFSVPLYCFALRYSLSLGVTAMHWDFQAVSPRSESFNEDSTPSMGFHVAPGVALLWPHGVFEGGAGFDYLAQAKGTIPSGFMGKLLFGVRL